MMPTHTTRRLLPLLTAMLPFFLAGSSALAAKDGSTLTFVYTIDAGPEYEAKQQAREKALKSYSALRAWQKTQDLIGDLEYRFDLNGDGVKERFVQYGGPARYSWYAIFARRHGRWRNIGEADIQDGSKLKVLRRRHHGWHDFAIDIEGPREAVNRNIYSWDNKAGAYDLKSTDEIHSADFSDVVP